jgi:glyoxylase-like metal-dependent hydrolase (beta-lactamase superfamily II)
LSQNLFMKKNASVPNNMFTVAPGVWGRKDVFVNFYMVQSLTDDTWVLIDAGLKWSSPKIREMANYLFGQDSQPSAIILTHGHFDHVGSVEKLAEEWEVPVYAHHMEIPYLTGQSDYPPPDPTVGGGLMAAMSFIYPKKPINIWRHVKVLPADGDIPFMLEWRYIHTPGHAPGHISLYRESDGVLIAGDAFVTTKQESALAVMMQTKVLSGPPKYFTYDWEAAENSVDELARLNPRTAATGHGKPMRGEQLREALTTLSSQFSLLALPSQSRYLPEAALTNANGVMYVPPRKRNATETALEIFSVTAIVVFALVWKGNRSKKRRVANQNLLEVEYNY